MRHPSNHIAKPIESSTRAASRGRCGQFSALLVVWLAATSLSVRAEEQDPSSLQKEVDQLRQEVESLKGQVKALKESPPASAPQQAQPADQPPPSSPAKAEPATAKPPAGSITALRESWSHVEKGMTKAQIQELLGPPTNELTINSKLVWYYYYAGIGGSSVFFNGDGRVSSHQRPTVGWW